MAGSGALPWLALWLASTCASPPPDGDPFAAQLGDISACQARCAQNLPPPGAAAKLPGACFISLLGKGPGGHFYTDAVLNACYRGCRLFSICHFVDPATELNATRAECESTCLEAYSGGVEQFGCMTGCRTQLPETESRANKVPDLKPASFSVFDLVSNFCNDIVSSAQSFISSTWTFYLQSDDGKVVVFQSQPEIEYPVPEVQAPKSEVSEKAWTVSNSNTMKPHTGQEDEDVGMLGLREKLEKPPVEELKGKAKGHPPMETPPSAEHDFLGCMSKRSGLPRWILAACLFLSIMVMLWLSCASLVTAPDQHVKTQPLSINGDKEYLDDIDGPTPYSLRPVIAVAICPVDDSEETGLLPVKVDLDKTAL
ncbi:transmembrane protein 59-like isoform X2 [Paroedura picta]|uniref:transmembrane protein 59-like isoform X2 n=1 Tax=Paroedura picta TaxID=143630 RepID=UPI00405708D5